MLAQVEQSTHVLVGQSPRIKNVLRMVEKLGRCRWPVLLLGETGTGKEVVARVSKRSREDRTRRNRGRLPGRSERVAPPARLSPRPAPSRCNAEKGRDNRTRRGIRTRQSRTQPVTLRDDTPPTVATSSRLLKNSSASWCALS